MALLSALVSIVHVCLLLLIPPLTFLWIIGKLKEIRLHNQHYHQHPDETYLPATASLEPSPSHVPLQPRRLSFSSVAAPNTPTPTSTPRRRVTFSLTPEQQANELLKTAVRRRESLPSANLLISHQAHPSHYDPTPQQIAHLFPSHNPSNRPNNPPTRSVYGVFQQQPVPAPPRQRNRFRAPDPLSPALQKRKTSPNKNQVSQPKRRRNPKSATTHPASTPTYAADLFKESDQSKERNSNPQNFDLSRAKPHNEAVRNVDQSIDNRLPTNRMPPPESLFFGAVVKEEPGQKRSRTPPSGRKPPKPPGRVGTPNGFDRQLQSSLPQAGMGGINRNGFVSGPVR